MQTSHEQRQVERSIHTSLTDYVRSGHWDAIEGMDFDGATAIVKAFLDSCQKTFRCRPDQLEPEQLRELLLHKLPKSISSKWQRDETAVVLVQDYFQYLTEHPPAGTSEFKLSAKHKKQFTEAKKLFAKVAAGETTTDGIGAETLVKQATVGRNDPCPCGSGKKFKKCCHSKG